MRDELERVVTSMVNSGLLHRQSIEFERADDESSGIPTWGGERHLRAYAELHGALVVMYDLQPVCMPANSPVLIDSRMNVRWVTVNRFLPA